MFGKKKSKSGNNDAVLAEAAALLSGRSDAMAEKCREHAISSVRYRIAELTARVPALGDIAEITDVVVEQDAHNVRVTMTVTFTEDLKFSAKALFFASDGYAIGADLYDGRNKVGQTTFESMVVAAAS